MRGITKINQEVCTSCKTNPLLFLLNFYVEPAHRRGKREFNYYVRYVASSLGLYPSGKYIVELGIPWSRPGYTAPHITQNRSNPGHLSEAVASDET